MQNAGVNESQAGIKIVVQSISCVRLFVTPWTVAHQASLSFNISRSLLKLMSTESVMLSNPLILCRPLFLLPSSFSSIRVFSSHWVAKVLELQLQPQSFRWISVLITFRIDWFGVAVQGTLKNLLQHNLKVSVLQCLAFSMVQISHPYLTTGKKKKNHSFDYKDLFQQSDVSAFLNTLSRFVITFLPKNKHILI